MGLKPARGFGGRQGKLGGRKRISPTVQINGESGSLLLAGGGMAEIGNAEKTVAASNDPRELRVPSSVFVIVMLFEEAVELTR